MSGVGVGGGAGGEGVAGELAAVKVEIKELKQAVEMLQHKLEDEGATAREIATALAADKQRLAELQKKENQLRAEQQQQRQQQQQQQQPAGSNAVINELRLLRVEQEKARVEQEKARVAQEKARVQQAQQLKALAAALERLQAGSSGASVVSSTSTSTGRNSTAHFKPNFLNKVYGNENATAVKCELTRSSTDVRCAHIWQHKDLGRMPDIGIGINNWKNALMLSKPVEQAMDDNRLCFSWDDVKSAFQVHMLDKESLSNVMIDGTPLSHFDGRHLTRPAHLRPSTRLLSLRALEALECAVSKKWVAEAEQVQLAEKLRELSTGETPKREEG